MKQYLKSWTLFLTVIILSVPISLRAEPNKGISIELPFRTEVERGGEQTDFQLELLADQAGKAVLPKKTLQVVKGNGSGKFGPITFTEPGKYSYILKQKKGTHPGVKYDLMEYRVLIIVERKRAVDGADMGQLTASVIVYQNREEKTEEIVFHNQYQTKEVIYDRSQSIIPKTGDKSEILLYGIILSSSVSGLIWFGINKRNRKRKGY